MPVNWGELEIREATEAEFNELPSPRRGRQPDPVITEILDTVAAGGLREIIAPDEAQLAAARTALNRGAQRRGFRLAYRTEGRLMIVRKSDEPVRQRQDGKAAAQSLPPRRRGRPRKSEHSSWSEPGSGGISGEADDSAYTVEES